MNSALYFNHYVHVLEIHILGKSHFILSLPFDQICGRSPTKAQKTAPSVKLVGHNARSIWHFSSGKETKKDANKLSQEHFNIQLHQLNWIKRYINMVYNPFYILSKPYRSQNTSITINKTRERWENNVTIIVILHHKSHSFFWPEMAGQHPGLVLP